MKKYLEYKDEKSAKFWEVTVEGSEVTVRYGKIGLKGRSKTNSMQDEESAVKYAKREIKAKKNKGYLDLKEIIIETPKPKETSFTLLPVKELAEKYDIWKCIHGSFDAPYIRYYKGDTLLHELDLDKGDVDEIDGIIVDGNLTILGNLLNSESAPFLFVTGNVQARNVILGDAEVWIKGSLIAENAIFMSYNHGILTVKGDITAHAIICADYHFECDGVLTGITISDGSFDSDFKTFEGVIYNNLMDIEGNLDWGKLETAILKGKPYVKKGVKPPRVLIAEMVAKLVKKGTKVTELDLSGKDLKELPQSLFDLTDLEELDLSNNDFKVIPPAIGQLKNLKVLKLGYVRGLAKLPIAFYELKNLEELYINGYKYTFSEEIAQLSKLRKLCMDGYGLAFPGSFAQLKNLEILQLDGSSNKDERLWEFPVAICELKNLKELELTGNAFKEIPKSIAELVHLETLNLNSNLAYLNHFPDLTKLKELKVVYLNGRNKATYDPVSPQSLLIEALSKLPTSIEHLKIDRWGKTEQYSTKTEKKEYIVIRPKLKILPAIIGRFTNLRTIDLSFNGLVSLPDAFYDLKKLESINLGSNQDLDKTTVNRLMAIYPTTKIIFGTLKLTSNERAGMTGRINELGKIGSGLMRSRKWEEAIAIFKEGLDLCKTEKTYTEYDYLYLHYGLSYCLNLADHNTTDPEKKALYLPQIMSAARAALALCPTEIWHYTYLGSFQREVIRTTGNALAWKIYISKNTAADLLEGLAFADRACNNMDGASHYFIYDTKVRLLLKLNRIDEAYNIVERVLNNTPSFGDFQDIKKSAAYKKWLKQASVI